jgi:hypothetical protein
MPVSGDVQKIRDSRFAAYDGQTGNISFLT